MKNTLPKKQIISFTAHLVVEFGEKVDGVSRMPTIYESLKLLKFGEFDVEYPDVICNEPVIRIISRESRSKNDK